MIHGGMWIRGLFHLETVSIAENQAISPTTSQRKPSGCRLYDQLRKYGLKSGDELKKQLGVDWYKKNIWDLNVDSANSFAAPIRRAYKDGTIVITPAPLENNADRYFRYENPLFKLVTFPVGSTAA